MKRSLSVNRLPSPLILFPALWGFAALLAQYHLLDAQRSWDSTMVAVVVAVPVAYVAGGLIGTALAQIRRSRDGERLIPRLDDRAMRRVLLAFLVIGYIELAHQFLKIGGIPLLSAEGNAIRFEQGGPTIVLTNLLTVAGLVAFIRIERLTAKESRFDLGITALALGGFALQAGRGSIALLIIVAVAARWLYWGMPDWRLLFTAGVLTFVVLSVGFYLRTRQFPYNPFEAEFYGEVMPGVPFLLKPLVPIYLAVTTNFHALQGVVGFFPTNADFGGGTFSSIGLDLILPNARNISDLSSLITPPWATSTLAGSLWADGGFAVVTVGSALSGVLSVGAFAAASRTRSMGWCLVAAYFLYIALFGIYTNLWTQQVDWLMVAPLLLVLGYAGDRRAPRERPAESANMQRMLAEESQPAAPREEPRGRSTAPRNWVLAGAGILAVLLITGFVIQATLPKPIPATGSNLLPASIESPNDLMTIGTGYDDNESLYWLVPQGGDRMELLARKPFADGPGTSVGSFDLPDAQSSVFDVDYWPPWRAAALFQMTQHKDWLDVVVRPSRQFEERRRPQRFRAPITAPTGSSFNEYAIATWAGEKPDLFVVTRGSDRERSLIRVLSGESGFEKQVYTTMFPFRGFKADDFSLDVGVEPGQTERRGQPLGPTKPDIVIVRHDSDKEYVDVELMPGERDFHSVSYQRDLDAEGRSGEDQAYLLGTDLGTTAVLQVVPDEEEGRLRVTVFGLSTPAGVKK